MLNVLCTGTIIRDPQERTSAAGKPYCTALVRVPTEGEDAALCSLIAFAPDAVRSILALSKGDGISFIGRAKLTNWDKDGEVKHGLGIVVEAVLTPYMVAAKRQRTRQVEEAAA